MFALEPQPTRADLNWKFLGFPVRVSPWFWLFTIVLGWSGSRDVDDLAVWTACAFVSILVHELGHALTARRFGAREGRIVFTGFGGLALNGGGVARRWQRVLEILGGPIAGIVFSALVWLVDRFALDHASMSPLGVSAVWYLIVIGFVWGALNLLPVFPLDGGQLATEAIVWWRPHDGAIVAMKFGVGAGAVACVAAIALWIGAGWPTGFLAAVFFLGALHSYMFLRALRMGMGAEIGGFDARPREAWERDPDWWKS
jgi:stage IV sporulation protein FB